MSGRIHKVARITSIIFGIFVLTSGVASGFPVGTGLNAQDVIGQSDFDTGFVNFSQDAFFGARVASADSMFVAADIAYDQANKRLFVADAHNHRYLVFDISGGLTANLSASFVLGQPDFVTGGAEVDDPYGNTNTQNPGNGCTTEINACGVHRAWSVAYDSANQRLFGSDPDNNRVLVWDLSGGITNGMAASSVLGQPDMITAEHNTACGGGSAGQVNACGMNFPEEISYDNKNDRLYVTDLLNHRVLVFDLAAGITDGMAASFVLGQRDFDSRIAYSSCDGQTDGMAGPCGLSQPNSVAVDEVNDRIFVSGQSRVLMYTSEGITNGMAAGIVLGQPDFATTTYNTSCGGGANGDTNTNACGLGIYSSQVDYNSREDVLYVSDIANHRILTFDVSSPTNGMAANGVLGQQDYTTGYDPGPEAFGGTTTQSTFTNPLGVYYDATFDRLFVADGGNHRVLVFGQNVNGTLVDVEGSVASWSTQEGTSGEILVDITTEAGYLYQVVFPPGTTPQDQETAIVLIVDNPNPTDRPRIRIYAKLPANGRKVITLHQDVNKICIVDKGDTTYLDNNDATAICSLTDIFDVPEAGGCETITVRGDLGDNPSNPNDANGYHDIVLCRTTDGRIVVGGLIHTLIQTYPDEENCSSAPSSTLFIGLVALMLLVLRRRRIS